MNVVKEFYIQQFQQSMPQIEHAFRWRLKTIPPGERIGSVTFAIASLIALVGSLCFGGAVLVYIKPDVIANTGSDGVQPFIISTIVFLIVLLLYVLYYRHTLNKHKEAEILEKQTREINNLPPVVNE